MKNRLEVHDLDGFLSSYEHYVLTAVFEPAAIPLTQVALPTALRRAFANGNVAAKTLMTISRLALNGSLLILDDDLRELINQHLIDPLRPLATSTSRSTAKSRTIDVETSRKLADSPQCAQDGLTMKRISIVSTFSVRSWSASDAFDLRKNLCNSQQEREFLRAIRQYFPSMQSYPNIGLRNFINIDDLGKSISPSLREFAWASQVDILLCTCDEDPVAGVELDSPWHDNDDAARRDELKNKLFQLAGLPLVRIRAVDPRIVRAEDFYELLNAEPVLASIRPRRMRPRRSHDGLAPENSATVRRW